MKTLKFPEINPKIRRFLIFFATVGAGSVLILYDPPIELLIGATVAVGCLMLLLLGAVHLSDLRPAMIRQNVRAWREKRNEAAEVQAPPVQKKESSGRIGAVLVSLPVAVHDGIGRLKATLLHRDKTFQEIDAKLDSTVKGQDAVPDPAGALPAAPIAGAGVASSPVAGGADPSDPLLDVSMEDLESLNLDDPENGSGASPSLDISLDNDLPMAPTDDAIVSGILEANSAELEEFSDLGDIDELAGLDEISLDELDLPDEADLVAEVDGLSPEPAADALASAIAPAAPPQPPAPVVEEEPEEENMLAFAMGGGDSDALMDLLKTDSKKQRKEDYNSLLRDMKDVKVSADDLVTGLQDTLDILKNPKKKKVKHHD
ncbi:MAG: hypothetical protein PHP59_05560 [Methanofollis sp.]|uniref:hypothetical protein n=1 Tax=Methanofollis sp. TaxID=2052835 RepID=UPI002630DD92|nr:hypothetical protein [Methanofollis sp.]MDD4254828.1 hypothetical protein [Methanofollis sp.]